MTTIPAPRRPLRRASLWAGAVLSALVLAVATLVLHFASLGWVSAADQASRLHTLAAQGPDAAGGAWSDPTGGANLDRLPYNELQVIGTHNSYAEQPTWLQTAVIGLVEPAQAPALQYRHAPLWDQLEAGIRSFELDLRWNGERFSVCHVPLVGNRSTAPDFSLALDELALWSGRHPGHLPISIMVEPKEDYLFLDPTLRRFDAAAFESLDAVLADKLGDRLFSPDDLRGSAASLTEAVTADGWPTVGELRGSFLFFFADNENVRESYAGDRDDLAGRSVFTSSRAGAADAVFAVRDDPADEGIASDTARGLIVRTRADADLVADETRRDAAFASGAQVVSTDFPPSEPRAGSGSSASFAGEFARAVP